MFADFIARAVGATLAAVSLPTRAPKDIYSNAVGERERPTWDLPAMFGLHNAPSALPFVKQDSYLSPLHAHCIARAVSRTALTLRFQLVCRGPPGSWHGSRLRLGLADHAASVSRVCTQNFVLCSFFLLLFFFFFLLSICVPVINQLVEEKNSFCFLFLQSITQSITRKSIRKSIFNVRIIIRCTLILSQTAFHSAVPWCPSHIYIYIIYNRKIRSNERLGWLAPACQLCRLHTRVRVQLSVLWK